MEMTIGDRIVFFSIARKSRGPRGRFGVPLEPDEPEGVEIDLVTDLEGNEVAVETQSDLAKLELAVLEDVRSGYGS